MEKTRALKIENPSDYWYYHEEGDKVWWFFEDFERNNNSFEFYKKYYLLTKKYRILNPLIGYSINNLDTFKGMSEYINEFVEKDEKFWLGYFYFSKKINEYSIYPSTLFVKTSSEISKKNIIDVNKLNDFDKLKDKNFNHDEVVYIAERGNKIDSQSINDIHIYIKNDVFFSFLYNRKTCQSYNELIKKNGVDNSCLAYLNTPRFNSFFRDFKKLCLSYGAKFSCEISVYETQDLVSPDGIFINGEIIYYEEIVDLLDEKYRIVDLSIDTDFKDYINTIPTGNKAKIQVTHNSKVKNLFTIKIDNAPNNVFTANDIENEEDILFSKENWITILFAGYSGPDKIMLYNILDIAKKYPNTNFAFKPYMDDDKMIEFSTTIENRMRTPIILYKNKDSTKIISSGIVTVEKLKNSLEVELE